MPKPEPPDVKITFVKPGELPIKRKRRLSREESGLRHDVSQFYSMKAVLEDLFGHPTYLRLKETGSFSDWKDAIAKLLRAIELSISLSVEVADDDWRAAIEFEIQSGLEFVQSADHMDELFCGFSATIARIVFTQIGQMPRYGVSRQTVPLTKEFWKLNSYRTVQYVQTVTQKETAARQREKREAIAEEVQQSDRNERQ